MKRTSIRPTLARLVAATFLFGAGWHAQAEETRVTFPEDLALLVHYATVKRGESTEHISTSREALEAIRGGKPVPEGTRFVLTDYRDEKVYRYFVMQKGSGWGQDYDERRRTGDWQFQWFWPDRRINTRENTARCQSCHQSQRSQNYLFTAERLRQYNGRPVE